MITAEAGIARRIESIFGESVRVVVGQRGRVNAAWARPEIYLQLSTFYDSEGFTDDGAHCVRRPVDSDSRSYAEERPGRIVLEVEICASEYAHVQRIRERLLAPLLSHLETLRELQVSSAVDGSTALVFRDFVATVDHFSIVAHPEDDAVLYAGQIGVNFDGFLHVQVRVDAPPEGPGKEKPETKAKEKTSTKDASVTSSKVKKKSTAKAREKAKKKRQGRRG
jgi:hypothetical protein